MQVTSYTFEAIGTHWQIDIPIETAPQTRTFLTNEIMSVINQFDKTYSRFRADSLVMSMAQQAGTYQLPQNALPLLTLYETLYQLTEGAFTPLIGQVLADAGYDEIYSLKPKKLTRPPAWKDILTYTHPVITLQKPALLDIGGAGKGYLIDLVGDVLKKNAIPFFCVDAGGDILYYTNNHEKLRVGLEHPANASQVIGIVEIFNQSICASAGNRRRWGKFHHIIDPRTLLSPQNILGTWVIAETGLLADALATCLFFVSPKTLLKKFAFSYVVVYQDYTYDVSKDFPGELFMK